MDTEEGRSTSSLVVRLAAVVAGCVAAAALVGVSGACSGCGASSSKDTAQPEAGDVAGDDDAGDVDGLAGDDAAAAPQDHCGGAVQATAMSACVAPPDGGVEVPPEDASLGDADEPTGGSPYGDPILGHDGTDDGCKYHVSWSSTPIAAHDPVTVTLAGEKLADGSPMAAAAPRIELVHEDGHTAPDTGQTSKETTAGHYTIGPVTFDASGRWTLRVQLYESCTEDAPESPRSHVGFVVDVP